MKKFNFAKVAGLLATLSLVGCGGSGSGSSTSTGGSSGSSVDCSTSSSLVSSSNVFPTSLAVSSLTSGCETSSSFVSALKSKLDVGANLVDSFDPDWSYQEKVAWFNEVSNGAARTNCNITIPTPSPGSGVSCYGPALYYFEHPDGSGGSTVKQLPTGDLGIWTSTEGSAGEACAAAKMNYEVNNAATYTDMMFTITSTINCLTTVSGSTLSAPTDGASAVDIASELEAVIQNSDSEFQISQANWSLSGGVYTLP